MKKIFLTIMIGVFLISLVGATQQSLGTFKQGSEGDCISLIQTCGNCTYNNVSRVVKTGEDSEVFTINSAMTKDDTYYNYSFCNITKIGVYNVNGFGDPSGTKTSWTYDFEITTTGFVGTLGFYFLILILTFGVIIFGYYIEDVWVVMLGGFGLVFVGLFILFNGIDIIKDSVYTWGIGIIILMLGCYLIARGGMEQLGN